MGPHSALKDDQASSGIPPPPSLSVAPPRSTAFPVDGDVVALAASERYAERRCISESLELRKKRMPARVRPPQPPSSMSEPFGAVVTFPESRATHLACLASCSSSLDSGSSLETSTMTEQPYNTVALFGATGQIGRAFLDALLHPSTPGYAPHVKVFLRNEQWDAKASTIPDARASKRSGPTLATSGSLRGSSRASTLLSRRSTGRASTPSMPSSTRQPRRVRAVLNARLRRGSVVLWGLTARLVRSRRRQALPPVRVRFRAPLAQARRRLDALSPRVLTPRPVPRSVGTC